MRCTLNSIEDVPLERIPKSADDVPANWERPGVYGVYNAGGDLQYVAGVRSMAEAMRTHIRVLSDPERVHSVRMVAFDDPSDPSLGQFASNWVMTHATHGPGAPPGNTDNAPEWRTEEETGPDICFQPGSSEEHAEFEIKRLVRDNPVVLFMKGRRDAPKCGFSANSVMLLRSIVGEHFKCVDCLDQFNNPGLRQGIKDYSQWPTIPQLYVNGDFVGGADIVQDMANRGELQSLVAPIVEKAQAA